jgi:hypothetical protein
MSADGDGAAVAPARLSVLRIWGVPGLLAATAGLIMLPSSKDDPDRWFKCASQMRAVGSSVRDPSVKLLALRVAKDLDWFAECLALHEGDPRLLPQGEANGTMKRL